MINFYFLSIFIRITLLRFTRYLFHGFSFCLVLLNNSDRKRIFQCVSKSCLIPHTCERDVNKNHDSGY